MRDSRDRQPNDIGQLVLDLFKDHPGLIRIQLIGSRSKSQATAYSDWDFGISVHDFDSFTRDLPQLVEPLHPLAQQWDRLSETKCYMLIVPGPRKIDFIFLDEHNEESGPWQIDLQSLVELDAHFWDWMLWLKSKDFRGERELVTSELSKLFDHLLQPMHVDEVPDSILVAAELYKQARNRLEDQFGTSVPRKLQKGVEAVLNQ